MLEVWRRKKAEGNLGTQNLNKEKKQIKNKKTEKNKKREEFF